MRKFWPYIFYGFITLAIMFPFYRPGFLFLLDMVFVPDLDLSDYLSAGIPPHFALILIIKGLSAFLGSAVVQKIILSLLLILPAAFMYRLALTYLPKHWAFFSGLIFMLNPWTYERFLSGQWLVYLGYAVFPLFIHLSQQLVQDSSLKVKVKWIALVGIYPMLNLHFAYLAYGYFLIYLLVAYWRREIFLDKKQLGKFAATALLVVILANSFWIFGFIKPSGTFDAISYDDFRAFPTASDERLGIYANVLSLYGFWNHDYVLPKDIFDLWWIPSLLIFVLFLMGVYKVYRSTALFLTPIMLFIPIFIVSLGAGSVFEPLIRFLYDFLPGFKGMRETSKIIGLLAFAYALIAPIGAKALAEYIATAAVNKSFYRFVFISLLIMQLLSVFSMANGFMGLLRPKDYPQSWYEVNTQLSQDSSVNKVLFLPWFAYMHFPFNENHIIANPAPRFFDFEVVASRNIVNENLPGSDSDLDLLIEKMVSAEDLTNEDREYLKGQGITHVMVAEEENMLMYHFFEHEELEVVFESNDLLVYKL